jgi:hypothetical protein
VFREVGTQVSPVAMLHPSPTASTPPCLLLFIKGPLKEGFWGLYFGLFGVGSLWKGRELLKGKIAEGKRIVEGKMLKGKIAEGKMLKGKIAEGKMLKRGW